MPVLPSPHPISSMIPNTPPCTTPIQIPMYPMSFPSPSHDSFLLPLQRIHLLLQGPQILAQPLDRGLQSLYATIPVSLHPQPAEAVSASVAAFSNTLQQGIPTPTSRCLNPKKNETITLQHLPLPRHPPQHSPFSLLLFCISSLSLLPLSRKNPVPRKVNVSQCRSGRSAGQIKTGKKIVMYA